MSRSGGLPPALRYRDYQLYWGGSVLSGIGTQFTTVAMAWQIYELTDSAWEVGLLGLARALPQIGMAVLGGAVIDNVDRRALMAWLQVLQFATSAALVLLAWWHLVTPEVLYLTAVLLALTVSLEQPTRGAVVANLLPPADLASGMALNLVQRQVGSVAGPALAGLVLALSGPAACYALDAASWLAMVAAVLAIRSPMQVGVRGGGWSPEAILGGAQFVMTQPVLLWFMVLDFGATLFGIPNALLPVFARDVLQVGPTGLGLLYASTSVGGLAASLAMSGPVRIQAAGRAVLLGVAAYGVTLAWFGLAESFWLACVLLGVAGAGNAVSAVLRGTSNQLLTPDHLRGRVGALNNAFVNGGPQLGQFRSGAVAELWGPQLSAFTGGVAVLLLAAGIAAIPLVRRFAFEPLRQPLGGTRPDRPS